MRQKTLAEWGADDDAVDDDDGAACTARYTSNWFLYLSLFSMSLSTKHER